MKLLKRRFVFVCILPLKSLTAVLASMGGAVMTQDLVH